MLAGTERLTVVKVNDISTIARLRRDFPAKLAGLKSEYKIDGEISGILDLLEPDTENEGMFVLSDYKTWGSYSVKKVLNKDYFDTQMQLNHYRVKLEDSEQLSEALNKQVKISRIQVQVTIRDGGTYTARKNGIEQNMMMLDIPLLDNNKVVDYYNGKYKELIDSLEKNILPMVCNSSENWNWKRCKGFCEVVEFCLEGSKIKNIKFAE